MPETHRPHRIEDLPRLAGATVAVRAWVTTTRSSGKIAFVMLRDGTGYVQAVVSKKDVPDAAWQACGKLTQETSVEVVGAVRADPRAPGGGGVELQASDLTILGPSDAFPIPPKEHGTAFRAEKSKPRRHLTEFWMVEPEVAWNDSDANMTLQEEFVASIVARCLERRQAELAELERDPGPLERVTPPFPRMSYTEAVEPLKALGADLPSGRDLGGADGTPLPKPFDRPGMGYNYPRGAKAFYMKENPADPRTVLNNDMLAPEGYGEIIGGSQREDDYDRLLARIREEGLPEEAYAWYLDLRKYGTFVHAGFGLGIERTVAWICGIPHIREAIAFPRTLYKLWP